jgi:hypothetical protein
MPWLQHAGCAANYGTDHRPTVQFLQSINCKPKVPF